MIHCTYGTTGIEVSKLGFGGMRFAEWDNPEKCAELVKAAYDKGITYFDTAPSYGDGKSEEHFGLAFKEMLKTRAEKPFYVATKSQEPTADAIRRDLEESLRRMTSTASTSITCGGSSVRSGTTTARRRGRSRDSRS